MYICICIYDIYICDAGERWQDYTSGVVMPVLFTGEFTDPGTTPHHSTTGLTVHQQRPGQWRLETTASSALQQQYRGDIFYTGENSQSDSQTARSG